MTAVENIQSLIPQKPPFVMVDKLVSLTETTSTTAFSIRADNIFVEGERFKEPGLVENIAQTAAARAGYISKTSGRPVQVGYIGAVNNLQVFSLPKTGDELVTEIIIEKQIFDVALISGTITCNGQVVARCNMKIFISQNKNS